MLKTVRETLFSAALLSLTWWNWKAAPPPPARIHILQADERKPASQSRAIVVGTNPSYTVYTVSNVAAFQSLWLPLPPGSLVYWGGLMITPGYDYEVSGSTFQVSHDPLSIGDRITVVTFPQ